MSGVNRHPLRKACNFCRSRKIKCSSETICKACRKQETDCIYDFDHDELLSRSASQHRHQQLNLNSDPHNFLCTDTQNSNPTSAPTDSAVSPGAASLHAPDIASELELIFLDNFRLDSHAVPDNVWHRKIASYHKRVQALSAAGETLCPASSGNHPDILSCIANELIALLVSKFGRLGCHHVESGGGKLLLEAFWHDRNSTMFDPLPSASDRLANFSTRKTIQMIEIWFSSHPLSFVLSKTLFMYQLRRGTLDKTLLTVILADAHFFMDSPDATPLGKVLLQWAEDRLRTHPYPGSTVPAGTPESPSGSSSSKSASPPNISLIQTLLILGWNKLHHSQTRRALCYIGLACRLASRLKEYKWSTLAAAEGSRMNGVDVGEVEQEIIAYIWWTSFTIFQWLFMQMDKQLPNFPQGSLRSIFLPVDAASSNLIRLDEASDHISTLNKQRTALLDMWPLAHVCSIVAHVYNLYPDEPQPTENPPPALWQEAALLAFGRIQNHSKSQNLDIVCQDVYRVLIDNVSTLDSKIERTSSRVPVLVMYHTVAIHVLFPRVERIDCTLTSESICRICSSAEQLLNIIESVNTSLDSTHFTRVQTQLHPTSPEIFLLALDTCSRAISVICSSRALLVSRVDNWALHESRLRSIAMRVYELVQVQFFSPGQPFRVVQKQVEAMAQQFGMQPPSGERRYHWCNDLRSSQSPSSVTLLGTNVSTLEADESFMTRASTVVGYPSCAQTPTDYRSASIVNDNTSVMMGETIHVYGDHPTHPYVYESELNDFHTADLAEIGRIMQYHNQQTMMDFDTPIVTSNFQGYGSTNYR